MVSVAETFQAIVNERRSIRAFTSDPVSKEIIDAVFAPALRAPSNCNTQPWFVHVVTGDKLEQLRETLPAAFAVLPSVGLVPAGETHLLAVRKPSPSPSPSP